MFPLCWLFGGNPVLELKSVWYELFFLLGKIFVISLSHKDQYNSNMNWNFPNSHCHLDFKRLSKGQLGIIDTVKTKTKTHVSSPWHRFCLALSQDYISTVFFSHLPFQYILLHTIFCSFLKSISNFINILWRESFACN